MAESSGVSRRWGGRRVGAIVAAVVVVAVIVLLVVLRPWADDGAGRTGETPGSEAPAGSEAPSASASPAAPPASSSSGATVSSPASPAGPSAAPSSAASVASPGPVATDEAGERTSTEVSLDQDAPLSGQVSVEVVSVEDVTGEAQLPGEVSGPALQFTVEIDNRSAAALDLRFLSANAYFGSANAPAAPFLKGTSPFAATIAAGATARGVYVFAVPSDQRGAVTLEVDVSPDLPVARFSGAAG